MNSAKLGVILTVCALILFILTLIQQYSLYKKTSATKQVSQQVLQLTEPVHTVYGSITDVSSKQISILQTLYPSENSQQETKTTSYSFAVSDKTDIRKASYSIPYLFITPTPYMTDKLNLSFLSKGMYVSITSDKDLRTAEKNPVLATNILILPPFGRVSGTLTKIEGNKITVKGIPYRLAPYPNDQQQAENTFEFLVNDATEISRNNPSLDVYKPNIPERVELTKLPLGSSLTVFTDTDVTVTKLATALRIRLPIVAPSTSSPSVTSLPTPEISPVSQSSPSSNIIP